MILNLLKIIFFYFIYRFIKVLIKGFVAKKMREASENLNNQMRNHTSQQNTYNNSSTTSPGRMTKTFDAEYKVIKE